MGGLTQARLQRATELPPEASFDDYLATEMEPDDVEVNPIDLSLAQMQSGSKGEPGAEVRQRRNVWEICLPLQLCLTRPGWLPAAAGDAADAKALQAMHSWQAAQPWSWPATVAAGHVPRPGHTEDHARPWASYRRAQQVAQDLPAPPCLLNSSQSLESSLGSCTQVSCA